MLRAREGQGGRVNKWEEKALKDLNNWREEGNGSIGGAEVKGLARLGDRDDICRFPNGREVSIVN
tara:strand:+ start:1191 stop:1385 length:195 start_codon:yes stop_codon:yes gene_type:complete